MDEALKFAIENGMIDLSYIQDTYEMNKRKELLSKHKWAISQGKDGYWRTYLPDKGKGRRMIKRKTRKSVEDEVINYLKEEIENPTIGEVYDEWIIQKLRREEISIATKNRYDRQFLECLSELREKKIKEVDEFEIEEFILDTIHEKQLTRKSYSNMRTLIYGIFKYAKRRKLVEFSISEVVSNMEISKKLFRKDVKCDSDLVFSSEECEKIMQFASENIDIRNLGILLLFKAGMRPGELAALKNVDVHENVIHVNRTEIYYKNDDGKAVYEVRDFPKTEAGIRDVIIPQSALWIIRKCRALNPFGEYMFEENGKRLKTYYFSKRLNYICKQLGIKTKSPNKIRKTYGTILIDANVSESVIISQMGHTDIKTTKKHYHKDRNSIAEKTSIINSVSGL